MIAKRLCFVRLILFLGVAAFPLNSARAELPEWIWQHDGNAKPGQAEVRYFRKSFTVEHAVTKALLSAHG